MIDWDKIVPGDHNLKVVLDDENNNSVEKTIPIVVDKKVTAVIVSPKNQKYKRNDKIEVIVTVNPKDFPIQVLMDGKEININTKLKISNYSLGNHQIVVKYQNNEIAKTDFSIITDFDDLSKTVTILYNSGQIKYFGSIYKTILSRIKTAEFYRRIGFKDLSNLMLKNLISIVNTYSQGRSPQISAYARKMIIEGIEFIRKN